MAATHDFDARIGQLIAAGASNKQIRHARMRRARFLATHTDAEWEALKAEFDHRCVRCGRGDCNLEKDHKVPVYQGGSDGIDNIQPCCAWCNAAKGPETTDWVAIRRRDGF